MPGSRPKALVTAPVAGAGLDLLREIADVVVDPWIDHQPLRIYNAEQLAERAEAEGANLLIVEADSCKGPVFERDLIAVCSCRGDPNNVDVEAATKAGVPVLRAPGRNADAVAEIAVGLLLAATRGSSPRTATSGPATSTRTAPSRTRGSAPGSSPDGRRGWSDSAPWAGRRNGASRVSG